MTCTNLKRYTCISFKMKTTNVGDAFAYSIVTANAIVKGYKDCPLKNVLALDFGTIINKCKNTCINK